jgi:hypothetical protein
VKKDKNGLKCKTWGFFFPSSDAFMETSMREEGIGLDRQPLPPDFCHTQLVEDNGNAPLPKIFYDYDWYM